MPRSGYHFDSHLDYGCHWQTWRDQMVALKRSLVSFSSSLNKKCDCDKRQVDIIVLLILIALTNGPLVIQQQVKAVDHHLDHYSQYFLLTPLMGSFFIGIMMIVHAFILIFDEQQTAFIVVWAMIVLIYSLVIIVTIIVIWELVNLVSRLCGWDEEEVGEEHQENGLWS
jgi:hypothetical protein